MISLICPAWNAEATLADTLGSVAAQRLSVDEIIVVDDGSADATAEIAAAGGARVLRQARHGPAAALNAGIAASRGDLLAFLDADDLWPPDKLALQTRILTEDPTLDGVLGLVDCFLCPSVPKSEAGRYAIAPAPMAAWLSGALLVRRARFAAVGNFDPEMAGGFFIDWCDRARRAGLCFALPRQIVLHRRIRPGSLSHRSAERDAGYTKMALAAIARRRRAAETA